MSDFIVSTLLQVYACKLFITLIASDNNNNNNKRKEFSNFFFHFLTLCKLVTIKFNKISTLF